MGTKLIKQKAKILIMLVLLFSLTSTLGLISAGEVTYNATNNRITIGGYTEAVPCTFDDIYNADKSGTLELWNGTPTTSITLTNQIKASEDIALKIDFILSSTGAGAVEVAISSGVSDFESLSDTPASYATFGLNSLRVNA